MNSQIHTNFSAYLKARLLPISPHSVLFPFYHAISDQDCPHLKNLYRVQGAKKFEKDIDELLMNLKEETLKDEFGQKLGELRQAELKKDTDGAKKILD